MVGDGIKQNRGNENEMSKIARRSIIAKTSLESGHILGADDLCVLNDQVMELVHMTFKR